MSDSLLQYIPHEPGFVPGPNARQQALALLRLELPLARDVRMELHETPRFVWSNFVDVSCPACHRLLDASWWQRAMDAATLSRFVQLDVTTPCCFIRSSLNALDYDKPAGFGRFVLIAHLAHSPSEAPPHLLTQLQKLLGCSLRTVWTRL